MIKAVFLDVGGTLLRPHPSVGAIYAGVAARHGVTIAPDDVELRFKEIWKGQRDLRKPVDKNWWREVVTAVFARQHFENFGAFFDDVYAAFEQKEAWCVFDDVVPALEKLRERSVRVAVVSNWDSRLPALLEKLDLARYFERQFISFETGLVKPDPLFFKRALEQMELHSSEAIHVGDDPDEDIKGAEAAGIRAYLIDRKARPLSSRMITTLDEIFVRI
jgi:putative hydrolase of the HAD superfamily